MTNNVPPPFSISNKLSGVTKLAVQNSELDVVGMC